ncbi:YchJ family protein [Nocardia sp. NPDC051570]|uniref:YchJ family protein n=1 Tax=Nocardia sp. NPDC051570 TaxID=3364324 RepID=UPI0037B004AC
MAHPVETDPCPCRSGEQFGACCAPRLDGSRPAPTAETLMRSRFTAFAVGDTGYLLRSWHPRTRPRRLELDPQQRWMLLEILRTARGGPFDEDGEVEFRAHYRHQRERGTLHECSRFARVGGQWLYIDGEIEP